MQATTTDRLAALETDARKALTELAVIKTTVDRIASQNTKPAYYIGGTENGRWI